jgi:hypothetical protein
MYDNGVSLCADCGKFFDQSTGRKIEEYEDFEVDNPDGDEICMKCSNERRLWWPNSSAI